MSGFENFKENCLKKTHEFYSFPSCNSVSDKEYQDVLKVWNKLELKRVKDYHDLYLKCDVALLVDVFEKITNRWLENYDLCPSDHLSAPALSWHAVFSITKI